MSHPWTPPLLQLSQQDPAIYHAIIATGIMSRAYEVTPVFSAWDSQSNSMYQVALQQYGKAVACFRWQLAGMTLDGDHSPSPQNALTCCVLLIIFEFMQGNASGVRLHLQNAIKIAAGLRKCPQGQLFANLLALIDMVTMMWLNLDQSYSDVSPRIPELYANKIPLTRQYDLETLTYDLVNIKNEVMTWRHAVATARRIAKAQGIEPSNNSYVESWRTIQSELDFWHRKYTAVSPNEQDITTHRPSLLRVNYLVTVLTVNEVRNTHLSAQPLTKTDPAKLEYFYEILELTEGALEAGYYFGRYDAGAGEELLEGTGLLPLFSFRNSFIQPLFYVAQKSPHIQLRQKAIRLLLEKPWREGAWDSFVMGSIAQGSLNASISEV
jgi:Fungal specific transcription factor domain